jgi:hypothetical protein
VLLRLAIIATHRCLHHRELMVIGALLGSLCVQAAIVIGASNSFEHYDIPAESPAFQEWFEAKLETRSGDMVILRRPLWCGALCAAAPLDIMANRSKSDLQLTGNIIQKYGDPNTTFFVVGYKNARGDGAIGSIGRVASWIVRGELSWDERRALREVLQASHGEYCEVLCAGWPLRCAVVAGSADVLDGRQFTVAGASLSMPNWSPGTHQRPRFLLGEVPLGVRPIELTVNVLTFTVMGMIVLWGLSLVVSLVLWRAGRCPACAYSLSRGMARCPECGCATVRI